ncbi:extracellular solute-binding protein [Streptomyces sp. NPDC051219]|uniref:extracellular solute-binding protein n=1 Tax=Streptomyces sp. NPDC051219 TaxID=3155283 RepID=UPI003449736A
MKNRFLAAAAALATAVALSACSHLPGYGDDTRTVTVWLMKDSASNGFLKRFTESFEDEHPDIELDIRIQEWTGIGDRIDAVLKGEETADVIEVGNTQVARYAENRTLTDLTLESIRDWGSKDWLPGLSDPGSVNGAQYGIPWYAANRVVIYNKDLFARAGIVQPPRTRAQWLEDTAKLDKGDTQGIYLAGQNWYVLSGFIWDEGGDLAEERGGEWAGALHTPAALKGMDFYKKLHALGEGPAEADEETPPQTDVFARGDVAQIIAPPGSARIIEEANPGLKGKLGFFPVPGKTAAKPGAVFTGGSDLVIPESTRHRDAAIEVIEALAGEKWQTELARTMSYVPNKTTLAHVIAGTESTAAMAAGAAEGRATPKSGRWAQVEAHNPIKPYMTAVLTGGEPEQAARTASSTISSVLAP